MFKTTFYFTFFILIAFSAVFTYSGWTHEEYPVDFQLDGSTYADVEGAVNQRAVGGGSDVHIHGIVYSWNDGGKHAVGDYDMILQVSMPDNVWDDEWWEPGFNAKTPVVLQDDFDIGVRREGKIPFYAIELNDVRAIEYQASATVRNQLGMMRDHIKKPINDFGEVEGLGPTYLEHSNNIVTPPTPGISVSAGSNQPGDSVTLNLTTSEPYYAVSWYVHTPWDTSSSGTYQQSVSGDGTATTSSFTYTFPSGSMHTGSFTFRAVIYKWSDMSSAGDETYTITVE